MAQTTTALQLIHEALDDLGVKAVGESLAAADAEDALARLNAMIDGWELQPGTLLNEQREVFPLVAGKGTPDDPYTMGPGGDFDTKRPVWVNGARLVLMTSAPPTELALDLLTDQGYREIAIKTLASVYPQSLFFNATAPLATIYLYPVPTTAANPLVLYSLRQVDQFVSLTASYVLAPGYREAIHYNLARRLAQPYSRPWTPELDELARTTLAWVKTANARLLDLRLDPALTWADQQPWNILAGP